MTQVSHWLGDPIVSIDTKCSAMPGFVAGMSSQMLDSGFAFYVRNSSSPSASVRQAIGGVPGTLKQNYSSYVDGVVGFATARCMVTLP